MIRYGQSAGNRAAVTLASAIALAAGSGAPGSALAQDKLPSVSDYHLPSPSASPRSRAQGPVDAEAPVVIAPSTDQSAPDSSASAPTAGKPAPKPKPSQAARTPSPQASANPEAQAQSSPRFAQPPRPTSPKPAASIATQSIATNAPIANNAATPTPAAGSAAAPFEWHVHSAADETADRSAASWPWMAFVAFLLGAGVMLLIQQVLQRRRTSTANAINWEAPTEPAVPLRTNGTEPIRDIAAAAQAPELPQKTAPPLLDLLSIMAEPAGSDAAPVPHGGAPLDALPLPHAVRDVKSEPLSLDLSARRLSATLMNAVLNYELTVSNTGSDTIGSIIVGGDMIGAHASLPTRSQLELSGNAIASLHSIAALAPGESVVLKGEFKLPLSAITPIRSGNAALFIPLARFRVESLSKSAVPLVVSRTFVVGEDQDRPGAALKPFRLDLGPRLYSQIGQRELALSA